MLARLQRQPVIEGIRAPAVSLSNEDALMWVKRQIVLRESNFQPMSHRLRLL